MKLFVPRMLVGIVAVAFIYLWLLMNSVNGQSSTGVDLLAGSSNDQFALNTPAATTRPSTTTTTTTTSIITPPTTTVASPTTSSTITTNTTTAALPTSVSTSAGPTSTSTSTTADPTTSRTTTASSNPSDPTASVTGGDPGAATSDPPAPTNPYLIPSCDAQQLLCGADSIARLDRCHRICLWRQCGGFGCDNNYYGNDDCNVGYNGGCAI